MADTPLKSLVQGRIGAGTAAGLILVVDPWVKAISDFLLAYNSPVTSAQQEAWINLIKLTLAGIAAGLAFWSKLNESQKAI